MNFIIIKWFSFKSFKQNSQIYIVNLNLIITWTMRFDWTLETFNFKKIIFENSLINSKIRFLSSKLLIRTFIN